MFPAGDAGLQAAKSARAWLSTRLTPPAAPQLAAVGATVGAVVTQGGPAAALLAVTALLIRALMGPVLGEGEPAGRRGDEGGEEAGAGEGSKPRSDGEPPEAGESFLA